MNKTLKYLKVCESTYIAFIKVSSLDHEIFDNTMECGTFVTKALLSWSDTKLISIITDSKTRSIKQKMETRTSY